MQWVPILLSAWVSPGSRDSYLSKMPEGGLVMLNRPGGDLCTNACVSSALKWTSHLGKNVQSSFKVHMAFGI